MNNKAPSLLDFSNPSIKTLHLTWIAFFLTFVVWFNMAGVLSKMIEQFDWLSKSNVKALLVTNVALTIPARIIVGGLIDKYGPRRIFAGLMVIMLIPGLTFAFGDNFTQLVLSRLALGAIGAGFVIGIKMTANWFTPKYIGRAEGFYAGWGNFGSAAAAAVVPFVAVNILGGDWRWSLAVTSIITAVYGIVYFFVVKDHPEGYKPSKTKKKSGSTMPVSSYFDLGQYVIWELPLYGALGLVAFVLHKQMINGVNMISMTSVWFIWFALAIGYLFDVFRILKYNLPRLKKGVPEEEKFPFGSVGALNTTYFANFGAELAIVSMLPMFFYEVFSSLVADDGSRIMTLTMAGSVAGSFAFMNLIARPLGGLISDKMGSRKKTMLLYMSGITVGFFLMATIAKYGPIVDGKATLIPQYNTISWLIISVVITMFASFFVQGAEGATFAIIPSIKKEMTGRIAGMAGAFGNVGAVTYLFLYNFMDDKSFLYMLSGGALISLVYCFIMLKEPKGAFVDSFE